MIGKSELSTEVAVSSSDFNAEMLAHWNTAAMASEVRQFAIVRIVQKKTDDMGNSCRPKCSRFRQTSLRLMICNGSLFHLANCRERFLRKRPRTP